MTISPTTAAANAVTATAATASSTLSGNFNTFLTLLTAQLKNQDPTSPLDTNQFTQQLVQYSTVEQQINTNTNLTTLIDLNRASSLYQASSMVGHQVGISSTQLSLQNGAASLRFSLANPQAVNITISDASGVALYKSTMQGAAGSNDWTWNGVNANGKSLPDGTYNVGITNAATATAMPFTVLGRATGVTTSGPTPSLSLGQLSVPMSAVQSIVN
jgi:flagellar basal-body rod modification protein FlgD